MPKTIQTSFALRQKIADNSDFINKRLTRGKILQQFRKSYISAFEKISPSKINTNIRRKIKKNEQIVAKINNRNKFGLRSEKLLKQQKNRNYLDSTFHENKFNASRTPTPVSKSYNTISDQKDDFPINKCRTRVLTRFFPKSQVLDDQKDDFSIKKCRTRVITRFFPKNEVSGDKAFSKKNLQKKVLDDKENIKVSNINKASFGIKKCRTKVFTRSQKTLSFEPLKKTRTRVLTRFGNDLVKNFE